MLSPQLFALVVGINHYRSSVVSDLGGCANDARSDLRIPDATDGRADGKYPAVDFDRRRTR